MLDTIKVAIPLSRAQHRRIHKMASQTDSYTWALLHQSTGETLVRKYKGLAQTDGESFHREIRFDYPPKWAIGAKLWLEFSVPKYWYSHNITMLYDWPKALSQFRDNLVNQFGLRRSRFPQIEEWEVHRADACYNYKMPSQQIAQLYLDSLKRQRFPRKQPTIYPHSLFFSGGKSSTISFKVYLKHPEFMAHDRKEMLSRQFCIEWIEHLEQKAEGVLRVEACMRRKYLVRMGIKTVSDLMKERSWYEWDDHLEKTPGFNPLYSQWAILAQHLTSNRVFSIGPETPNSDLLGLSLKTGRYYHAPDMQLDIGGMVCYYHPAGGFTYHKLPVLLDRLRTLLHRFLGGIQGMQTVDKAEAKLLQHYKPVIAAKLIGFWLYVKQFGADKAKETFGKTSYYYQRRQLKAAGVGLMESNENIIKVDAEFFRNFQLDIPSEFAYHKEDEFRNSGNILNLEPYRHDVG